MRTINANSYKGKQIIASAQRNEGTSLSDVYGSYSSAKANAMRYCRCLCADEAGKNFRITSHNTFGFSVAWETADGLRVETPNNSYFVVAR